MTLTTLAYAILLCWVLLGAEALNTPSAVPSPLPPTDKAPTKAPIHIFDTLSPTRAPTPPSPTTAAPSLSLGPLDCCSQPTQDYMVVVAFGVAGGIVVVVCCAILIYWQSYTRVRSDASGGGLVSSLSAQVQWAVGSCCGCRERCCGTGEGENMAQMAVSQDEKDDFMRL
mmetsp:Transcript_19766/g.36821  ORF Transcript_19766/g.36821 Transcript_19766/m.36821 type:complete len:170 (-) Transcript_19766:385-894(-)